MPLFPLLSSPPRHPSPCPLHSPLPCRQVPLPSRRRSLERRVRPCAEMIFRFVPPDTCIGCRRVTWHRWKFVFQCTLICSKTRVLGRTTAAPKHEDDILEMVQQGNGAVPGVALRWLRVGVRVAPFRVVIDIPFCSFFSLCRASTHKSPSFLEVR